MDFETMNACCVFLWLFTCLHHTLGLGPCDQVTNVCINGACQNQSCTCNPGFILDPINPLLCNPIPQCNLMPGSPDQQCSNGICLPQPQNGQFSCSCYPGYTPNVANPNICDDVDECLTANTGCTPGLCFNTPGDYVCSGCVTGYILLYGKCEVPMSVPALPKLIYKNPINGGSFMMAYLIDDIFL
ncbi:latent-transforming growth factor beta-binding protein 3-like [Biomphalaria glabrata]|uniref:Latent-transforming growth factor beta-binding protein 3-like n=2 Tax=Biomphalaria glabrata TaxID=6526 RepID=A0A9W2YIP2_BIOGL|nr:latent-transforming growth factor beta-binding protein 3-like [Biomphalaria glabrata]KAI8769088.1 latent-transforming growth factor beta-binding protein 3-like; partial [Biomphalaria glabrata]